MLAYHLLQFSNSLVCITLPRSTDPPLLRVGFGFFEPSGLRKLIVSSGHRELTWLTILLGYTFTVALVSLAILIWLERE